MPQYPLSPEDISVPAGASTGIDMIRRLGAARFPSIQGLLESLKPAPRPPVRNADGWTDPRSVKVTDPRGDIELPAEPHPAAGDFSYQAPSPVSQPSQNPIQARLRGPVQGLRDMAPDANSELMRLQGIRADELENKVYSNQRAQAASYGMSNPDLASTTSAQYGGEAKALSNMLGGLRGDIEANPLTHQRADIVDTENRTREAQLGGFPTPQVQAGYGREQEREKLLGPQKIAQIGSQGEIEKQRLANEGALDTAKEYTNLQRMFLQNQGQGGRDVRSLNIGPKSMGVGFNTTQTPTTASNPLLNRLTEARGMMDKAKPSGMFSWFGDENTPEKATFDQALAAVVANTPGAAELKSFAEGLAKDPSTKDLPFSQIMQTLRDNGETQITPDEEILLQNVISAIRGF